MFAAVLFLDLIVAGMLVFTLYVRCTSLIHALRDNAGQQWEIRI